MATNGGPAHRHPPIAFLRQRSGAGGLLRQRSGAGGRPTNPGTYSDSLTRPGAHTIAQVVEDLDLTETALRSWVRQAPDAPEIGVAGPVKHVNMLLTMKRMTVRDVRLHWPEAEKALARHDEIIVTRDGQPVARLVPYRAPSQEARPRFEPRANAAWLSRFWSGKSAGPTTDDLLGVDRAD
jgi:antitoxin (DNA-binding transcriptional repressor) of toxin-antitoxin stability system